MAGISRSTARRRKGGDEADAPSATARAEEAVRASVALAGSLTSEREAKASLQRARAAALAAGDDVDEETADEQLERLRSEAMSAPAAAAKPINLRLGVAFWIAVGWLVLVVFGAIFFRYLHLKSATQPLQGPFDSGPSWHNWLGTDQLGHDIFAQIVYGARYSMIVGAVSVVVGIAIGGGLGLLAGFYRGAIDVAVVWVTDVLLTLPGLILALTIVTFLGESFKNTVLAIAILSIPAYARIARAATFNISQQEFVLAALSLGARPRRILWREVLPLVALPISSFAALGASIAILAEGALAFLGLTSPTEASWGLMISNGQSEYSIAPQLTFAPMAALFLTLLALNYIGQTFGSALDPRQARI
ncbi:MAG: ABC transporter permease [Acidimicrobiales bacterium]